MSRITRRWVALAALSIVAIVSGAIAYDRGRPTSFGWFAYTPLPETIPLPSNLPLTNQQVAGIVLMVIGATGVVLALGSLVRRPR